MFNEIVGAYKNFWIQTGNFKGLTTRSDWWWVQLINFIISIITIPFFYTTFGFNIYGLICLLPQIAIDIRRIRDFGKDWQWIFINLIPIIGGQYGGFGWVLASQEEAKTNLFEIKVI